jgi:hypothetical protein
MASAEAAGAPSAASAAADSAAPRFASVAAYVRALGGHSPVRKVLIANNGIAVRLAAAIFAAARWGWRGRAPPCGPVRALAAAAARPPRAPPSCAAQAVKCIRSIRRWAYDTFGNEREVRALFT